jgi:hypothetical protein
VVDIKVEFLLPFKDNNQVLIKPETHDNTYRELDKKFRGFTVDYNPLFGSWRDNEGRLYKEKKLRHLRHL